ncbi:subtilisin-like protein [Roridomyces roridus]|uniref:tripeptidyl-peptidase II n=1 Tax=Roridomyces roridus TaxID=1738132 RepID=A0AAD7FAC9_9AGAR|nr:subtilisin-like protein [Roridomyces roridus]
MSAWKLAHILTFILSVSAGSLLHSRSAAPEGFIDEGVAPSNDNITLRFALAGRNASGLRDTLITISTPGSPSFRKWLSKDEVKSFVEPSSQTLAAFDTFAAAHGLAATPESRSVHGDWVSLSMPVSQANALFAAQFKRFSHRDLTQPITRTLSMSLPAQLVGHVEAIHPSTFFYTPRSVPAEQKNAGGAQFYKRNTTSTPQSCNTIDPAGAMNPACLQALYGIPLTPIVSHHHNRILLPALQGRVPSPGSLESFLTQFRPDIAPNTTFNLIKLDNPSFNATGQDGIVAEADLDVEYTIGLATGVPVDLLSIGGNDTDIADPFLDMISFIEGLDDPPSVVSMSSGLDEADVGFILAQKICDGYARLGARGISVLFAAGDGGVRGPHDNITQCGDNTFIPVFPASCPWVTSVGGTQGVGPEIAANLTGGGFSNFFLQPKYQQSAVKHFLSTGIPKDFPGRFNVSGRGYPDVATQAWNLQIFSQGHAVRDAGTSFAAPIFAAIIALINDRLLYAGEPRLGFLNPWLYEHRNAFTDIKAGRNTGLVCPATSIAFEAIQGWDALTGMGTPKFSKLLHAAFAQSSFVRVC